MVPFELRLSKSPLFFSWLAMPFQLFIPYLAGNFPVESSTRDVMIIDQQAVNNISCHSRRSICQSLFSRVNLYYDSNPFRENKSISRLPCSLGRCTTSCIEARFAVFKNNRLKIRGYRSCSVHMEPPQPYGNLDAQPFKFPREQNENIEWSRVSEVPGQNFQPVENSSHGNFQRLIITSLVGLINSLPWELLLGELFYQSKKGVSRILFQQ